ncbi:MAG: response regulator [bacterium]
MFLNNPTNKKRQKILIIDDDIALCTVFKDILDQSGYQTFVAQNEEDVLSIITRETPDLVYVDLEMPDLDTSDISNQIKRVNPNTMIVLISGYPPHFVEDEVKSSIGSGIIDKFIDKGDLSNLPTITAQLLSERPN